MCGLAGFFGGAPCEDGDEFVLGRMGDTLIHRGPDDAGVWCDSEQRIGLAHRRLAVVDLSAAGHQPMVSASGRFVLAWNGEIYNHLELRGRLHAAPAWRGHSDTETLLAAVEAWGLEAALMQCAGMFALALWDRHARTLTLARDRVGEKPLYYGWQGRGNQRTLLFASEPQALKQHPRFAARVDRGALCLLLRHNYIPAPHAIYEGVAKLEPGTLLTVAAGQSNVQTTRYWDVLAIARAGAAAPFTGTEEEAIGAVEQLASEAVRHQMMADVPVGAFLSGGIDSSTVVALMQAQSTRRVRTFTIGFHEAGYNEAEHAKAVARHLGTDHTELYVTPNEAMAVIPSLSRVYSEPFADATQIPNILLSRLARSQVTVALSGDAGDELFCGYDRYWLTQQRWNHMRAAPRLLRQIAVRAMGMLSPGRGSWLAARTVDELYRRAISHVANPAAWVIGGAEPRPEVMDLPRLADMERMMASDMRGYLPDDILVKVDRAAMAASLETRVPFLDHRFVEFAWKLPLRLKMREAHSPAQSKWALRQVLYRYVPRELVDRPKQGFSVPLHAWLRGPLREWAESLIGEARLRSEGFFHPSMIRQFWRTHLSGCRDESPRLWNVLMFQAWLAGEQA